MITGERWSPGHRSGAARWTDIAALRSRAACTRAKEAAMPCEKLLEYLQENGIDFDLIDHPQAYAARDVAFKAGVRGREFAKTVLVKLDGLMAMAVIPAEHKVNFTLLREVAGAGTISLALEDEFEERFPDCELGAMPPFGNLYGMRVIVDERLGEAETITFNAGTHTEAVTMAYTDFVDLVRPEVASFTFQPLMEYRGEA
jgi:Ala-tRNA(Pro) deacylase